MWPVNWPRGINGDARSTKRFVALRLDRCIGELEREPADPRIEQHYAEDQSTMSRGHSGLSCLRATRGVSLEPTPRGDNYELPAQC